MQTYWPFVAVLIALLAGLAAGKGWERYKLVEGHWIDRRRVRQSPHFILGLNYLVAGQVDLAIDELEKASTVDPGALELRLVLGNLYREKGQVGRAISEHQALLQRPRLNRLEHANVLLCLGLDYRRGGFVDRAVAAFSDVLKLDGNNEAALVNLEKLQEDQHQWQEAYVTRSRLAQIAGPPEQPRSQSILAFLENELGLQALKGNDRHPGLSAPGRGAHAAGQPLGGGRDLGAVDRGCARSRLPGARPAGVGVRRSRRRTAVR
jgi:lipopolysaccharide biosynthesis regulator YciM